MAKGLKISFMCHGIHLPVPKGITELDYITQYKIALWFKYWYCSQFITSSIFFLLYLYHKTAWSFFFQKSWLSINKHDAILNYGPLCAQSLKWRLKCIKYIIYAAQLCFHNQLSVHRCLCIAVSHLVSELVCMQPAKRKVNLNKHRKSLFTI